MNDKLIGVTSITIIMVGLMVVSAISSRPIDPVIEKIATVAISGILGNMIGMAVRTKFVPPKV